MALQYYSALTKIQKYEDKNQKKSLNDALDEFMLMKHCLYTKIVTTILKLTPLTPIKIPLLI